MRAKAQRFITVAPPVGAFIVLTAVAGAGVLVALLQETTWGSDIVGRTGLFVFLVALAGFFPFPVGPRIKAGVTTAPLLGAVLLLPPGAAALAGCVGTLIYQIALQARPEQELHLPWFKYPFNAGQVILNVGVGGSVFNLLGGDPFAFVQVFTTLCVMYLINTGLVSLVAGIQMERSPFDIWWVGTRQGGLAELSLFAFGYLGAIAYQQSPWMLIALLVPVAVIYIAFSRLAHTNSQLEETLDQLKELQGKMVSTAKLASVGAFSLDLAHQLRNPLFIVMGNLEMLQEQALDEKTRTAHVNAALSSTWRMRDLVQNFADMGHQRWANLSIAEVLEDSLGVTLLRCDKSMNIVRSYDEKVREISGNPVLLREAFSNLISNALDASPDGGQIVVEARAKRGVMTVRIADKGSGIPPDQMKTLFEPFHSRKPGGLGLGLFSAKHIIEMHRGSIHVESTEWKGTKVEVELPANPVAGHSDTPDSEDSQSGGAAGGSARSSVSTMRRTT